VVTNFPKTEAVYFHKILQRLEVKIGSDSFHMTENMKALGFLFDHRLSWTDQVSAGVAIKGRKMSCALKFIIIRLNFDQFLLLTSQFYSFCFCACNVWLNGKNNFHDIRKLNAIHYCSISLDCHQRLQEKAEAIAT